MKGEFFNIAQAISRHAAEGGLAVADLTDILSSGHGIGNFNCYPGIPGDQCYPVAFFIALHGSLARGRGHYNIAQILELFIRHMQGQCAGATRHAVIITNAWWHDHHEKWYANIETIKRSGVHLEAFLIGKGDWASPIDL